MTTTHNDNRFDSSGIGGEDTEPLLSSSSTKSTMEKKQRSQHKSLHSVYNSIKEKAVTDSDYFLYAISIILLVSIVFVMYWNYSNLTASGFLWLIVQFVFVLINSWINTVSYLHKSQSD